MGRILHTYRMLSASHPAQMRILRFLISGGTAAGINLGTLFVLTHFFDVWYLLSSVVAFILSFFVSFTLQKFWTFNDTSLHRVRSQAFVYLLIGLSDLGLNTLLMFSLVEYAHVHYLVAQLVCMAIIAVINFFSYKHFVFRDAENSTPAASSPIQNMMEHFSFARFFFLALAGTIFLTLALYRLPETPPTWIDEGIISQVAINLAQSGVYGVQIAPGHFVSADFVTTSFPVIYPIALSFSLFGTTLLNARVVMVLFMGLLCIASYLLIRTVARERKYLLSLFSLYLLVTFAPMYGHGKNVLGEVPGLLFVVASLLFFHKAERSASLLPWILSGVLAGLAMATKPIYLLLILPSALLTIVLRRKRLSLKGISAYGTAALGILLLWFAIHFTSLEALKEIVFASNPNNTALFNLVFENLKRFLSEAQPLYCLGLLSLWWGSLLYRRWRGREISTAELFAAIFSVFDFLLYLGSRGFYRYFFPAEALALIFLPIALYELPIRDAYRTIFLKVCTIFIVLLIAFQGYQTLFRSWISESRSSTRSALLSEHLSSIPEQATVFLYRVPEAAIFLRSPEYYQYLPLGETIQRGSEYLPLLFRGEPDFVLVDEKFADTDKILPFYNEISRFDKYVLYEKTVRK